MRWTAVLAAACLPAAVLFTSGAVSADARVEVEINDTATTQDDYLCWSPTRARVRSLSSADKDMEVILVSESSGTGAVQFSRQQGILPSRTTYVPAAEISLTLPKDGSWIPFFVNGSAASTAGKDVKVVALSPADRSLRLGETELMVRVRKDAEKLTAEERQLFLEALKTLHGNGRAIGPGDDYLKYSTSHEYAFGSGIHGGGQGLPLFLAWHRAFILSLERELQAIDARVTLPYWRFDEASTSLFTPEFLGQVQGGPATAEGYLVRFSRTNPLKDWSTRSDGGLRRERNAEISLRTVSWNPSDSGDTMVAALDDILQNGNAASYGGEIPSEGANAELEFRHHNGAHAYISGWLGSAGSPRDPMFFLLHANVDRAWAEWQTRLDRFGWNDVAAYPAQGSYPGPGDPDRLPYGSYAEDQMWPWSRKDGSATPGDPGDDWPTRGFDFPRSAGSHEPLGAPRPRDMIDFMNVLGKASSDTGTCYDHIGYFGIR